MVSIKNRNIMEARIWKQFVHIVSYRKDLIDVIRPFMKQLNNKNKTEKYYLNDEIFKYNNKDNNKDTNKDSLLDISIVDNTEKNHIFYLIFNI